MSSTTYGRRTPGATEIEFNVGDLDQDSFDDGMTALTAVLSTVKTISVGFGVTEVLGRFMVVVSTGTWQHRVAMTIDAGTAQEICNRFVQAMHASQVIAPKTVN